MSAATLRGTARGLEIHVATGAELGPMIDSIEARLAEAPGFFAGNDVRVRVEDKLPRGALGRLDELAERFDLKIVEIGQVKARKLEAIPHGELAAGSVGAEIEASPPANTDAPPVGLADATDDQSAPAIAAIAPIVPSAPIAPTIEPALAAVATRISQEIEAAPAPVEKEATSRLKAAVEPDDSDAEKTKVVVGPIRSGVILSHRGNIVIYGDVNPGAEVRAEGNITILGRLRGTAHAGIGGSASFILALRLEPQQLRIGRQVARASDNSKTTDAEIAHIVGDQITVETYLGKLPRNLAAGI